MGVSTLRGEDWTVSGKDYHNVIVGQVEANKVHITYDGGLGTIAFADLQPELQKRFNYDPEKAKKMAALAADEKAVSDAKQILAAACQTKPVQIIQVLPDGILVNPMVVYQGAYGLPYYKPSDQIVFIHSKFAHVVDGDQITVRVYRSGEYSYQTALGSIKTVEEWIAPPKEVFEASN